MFWFTSILYSYPSVNWNWSIQHFFMVCRAKNIATEAHFFSLCISIRFTLFFFGYGLVHLRSPGQVTNYITIMFQTYPTWIEQILRMFDIPHFCYTLIPPRLIHCLKCLSLHTSKEIQLKYENTWILDIVGCVYCPIWLWI